MEESVVSPEDALDVLRRSSNLLDEKLTAVAMTIAERSPQHWTYNQLTSSPAYGASGLRSRGRCRG
jgi:hypothetical protein